MRRKFVYIAMLLGIALTSSNYWKYVFKYINKTVITLRSELFTEVSLQPFPTTCKNPQFVVIIVTSYVGHVELRTAHRTAYPAEELIKANVTRVFLLGQIPYQEKSITQSAINNESKTFGDILQGTFVENYRNLTYKHLMGLKWASSTCHDASFILKVDDDAVYFFSKTYEFLKSVHYSTSLLMGYYLNNTEPRRNKNNKWYVTWDEFPGHIYPTYLSGWYYITTPQVAAALCDEAIYHPYFWVDDIFVTGTLRESLGINITVLPDNAGVDNFMNCHYIVGPDHFECKLQ